MNNLEITWIAVGIGLTTATQLRPNSPVGPGEAMLFFWMLLVGIRLLFFRSYLITPFAKVFLLFWIVSFTSLALGVLIAESNGLTSEGAYHDAFAFLFSLILCLCLDISIKSPNRLRNLIAINISFVTLSLVILLFFHVPFLAPWYGGARFAGWANNPNQLALLITLIPFLALHLINQSSNRFAQVGYSLLIFGSVIAGIRTDSDALMVSWAIGILVIIILWINQLITNYIKTNLPLKIIKIYRLVIGIIVSLIGLIFLYASYEKVNAVSSEIYNKGNQGNDRVTLWKHGIEAIYYSPLFGLGPGSHSGVKEPFLDFESHNTFIDWGSSSGIIGLIAFVSLLGWVSWKAWRSGFTVMVASVISLAAFSSFHFVLRHAIFWFYLLSIVNLSKNPLKHCNSLSNTTKQIKNYLKEY